ncbi:MAG: class I SAM-dependent methyltransferase, partial [SAR202 cluster bacterium]|nr:class I SAM-dependent methyltransferase [SAR202 cluster bacterium]
MSILGVKKTNIGEFFDGWYDGKFSANYAGYIESMQLEEVLDSIPLSIQDILDHGCGQGSWIHLLQDKFLNAKITGIDISKNGIDVTKKLFPKHTFLFFDGETAPLTDNSYDLIFSYHVLDAVWDLNKSLLDISRLLKKGGYLVIVVPCANENSFEEKITRLVKGGKENTIDGFKRFFYSYFANVRRMQSSEIIKLLSKYNFRVYKEFYSCHFWGAIDKISKSSFSFLNELFDYRRGVNVNAKIKLFLLQVIFITLLCVVKLSTVRNFVLLNKVKQSS